MPARAADDLGAVDEPGAVGAPGAVDSGAVDPANPQPDPALRQFGRLLDDVIGENTAIAAATYRRYHRIDQLRLWSESAIVQSLGGPEAVGAEPEGWNAVRQAREELLAELAWALHVPYQTAATLVWEAKTLLHDLPLTADALLAGEIGPRYAAVMIGQVQSIPEEARGEFEEAVLPYAKNLTVSKFATLARKKRESMHPESLRERHVKELSERRVWVTPDADGMAYMTAYLSAEVAVAASDRLTQIAQQKGSDGDDRHTGQKRADAFADLLLLGDTCSATDAGELITPPVGADSADSADSVISPLAVERGCGSGAPAARGSELAPGDDSDCRPASAWGTGMQPYLGHGIRPRVLVTVPVMTLMETSEAPANLEGYGPIDADTARVLARSAPSFTRILTNPVTSSIIDIDRATYAVPADLRLALRVQDETCRGPGCNQSAEVCDIDHNRDYAKDGKTRISNLCHLCKSCHRRKHHTRVTIRNLKNGDIEWTTPSGKTYTTQPMNRLVFGSPVRPGVWTEHPGAGEAEPAALPF